MHNYSLIGLPANGILRLSRGLVGSFSVPRSLLSPRHRIDPHASKPGESRTTPRSPLSWRMGRVFDQGDALHFCRSIAFYCDLPSWVGAHSERDGIESNLLFAQDKRHLLADRPEPIDNLFFHRQQVVGDRRPTSHLEKQFQPISAFLNDGACILNSPADVRDTWTRVKQEHDLRGEFVVKMDHALQYENALLQELTGELVSIVISNYLIDSHPRKLLASNGKSDYPDLYLNHYDYSALPKFSRKAKEYGAALKGGRPVKVPDGLEIKSCDGQLRVDCHNPHAGLHLALVFQDAGRVSVDDILVAFLTYDDYHHSGRNTEATTVKHSFNDAQFVSLLTSKTSLAVCETEKP